MIAVDFPYLMKLIQERRSGFSAPGIACFSLKTKDKREQNTINQNAKRFDACSSNRDPAKKRGCGQGTTEERVRHS